MAVEHDIVRAWANLHFTYGAVRKLLDERLHAEADCSLSDLDVLTELHCTPDHRVQMLALADRLGGDARGSDQDHRPGGRPRMGRRDRPAHNRREVYAVITEDGSRTFEQGRAVYIRLLTETLGAHLDDVALHELATSTGKLLKALT